MEYTDLTTADYTNILKGYNMEIPRDKTELKRKAEKVIAIKLCGCIRKVSNAKKTGTSSNRCLHQINN